MTPPERLRAVYEFVSDQADDRRSAGQVDSFNDTTVAGRRRNPGQSTGFIVLEPDQKGRVVTENRVYGLPQPGCCASRRTRFRTTSIPATMRAISRSADNQPRAIWGATSTSARSAPAAMA